MSSAVRIPSAGRRRTICSASRSASGRRPGPRSPGRHARSRAARRPRSTAPRGWPAAGPAGRGRGSPWRGRSPPPDRHSRCHREHREGRTAGRRTPGRRGGGGPRRPRPGAIPVAAPDPDPRLERPGADRQRRAVFAVGDGLAEDVVRRLEVPEQQVGGALQPERVGVPLAVGAGLVHGERGVREHAPRSVGAHDGAKERPLRLERTGPVGEDTRVHRSVGDGRHPERIRRPARLQVDPSGEDGDGRVPLEIGRIEATQAALDGREVPRS